MQCERDSGAGVQEAKGVWLLDLTGTEGLRRMKAAPF